MKPVSSKQKSTRHSEYLPDREAVAGPNGLAISPPAYGIDAVDNQVIQAAAEPTQTWENETGLPDKLKVGVETLSGQIMDDVKVHYHSPQPAQLQALAYTQGTDILVAPGQEKHLPHEAWHVVQQKRGRVKPTMQLKGNVNINDDAGLEKEADVMGDKAFQFVDNRPKTESIGRLQQKRNNNTPVAQRMAKTVAEGVVGTVRTAVPDAGNRLFDIISTWGESVDKNKITDDVLNHISGFAPFGTTNINTIATRASVANVTKGAVCDNYQEMVIAEMDHSGTGIGETVRAESYPGHSYVSVEDPVNPANRNEDLIVDAWRNFVDKRSTFRVFSKYTNQYTRYGQVAMAGLTDWLNPAITGNMFVRWFLNLPHININTGNLQADIDTYKEQNPGRISLGAIYPY